MARDDRNIVRRAYEVARRVHAGQRRKGSGRPYIAHPVSVARILREHGYRDAELLAAALLHDAIEDQPGRMSFAALEKEFGPRVRSLVEGVTEPRSPESGPQDWRHRKRLSLRKLRTAPDDVRLLGLADRYANLLDLLADLRREGTSLWERFNAGPKDQYWYYDQYYRTLRPHFRDRLPLLEEYRQRLAELRRMIRSPA